MAFNSVYFSLGSNLGHREANLEKALDMMDKAFGGRAKAVSRFIDTAPWGEGATKRFLNCCALYRIPQAKETAEEDCLEILAKCKEIERSLGRREEIEFDKEGRRIYHDRTIDIDILFYGTETIDTEDLKVPHPLISQRVFVLIPLREIAKPSLRAAFPELFD